MSSDKTQRRRKAQKAQIIVEQAVEAAFRDAFNNSLHITAKTKNPPNLVKFIEIYLTAAQAQVDYLAVQWGART